MALRLGDILVGEGLVSAAQLDEAIKSKAPGIMLGDWLVQTGTITRQQLGSALQRQFEVSYADIDVAQLNPQIVRLVPESFAVIAAWWLLE